MSKLLKDPAKALQELRRFQIELQQLQTRYYFGEFHSADEDFKTDVMQPLYQAEKASMILLDKLVEVNASKKEKELHHA